MSRFVSICDLKENGKSYRVYQDKQTKKYYKVNGDEVIEFCDRSIIKAKELKNKCKVVKAIKASSFAIASALLISASSIVVANISEKTQEWIEDKKNKDYIELEKIGSFNYLIAAVKENNSIDYQKIEKYLKILSQYDLNDEYVIRLGNLLKNYQFGENVITREDLELLLGLEDHGFVANELYAYVNGIVLNDQYSDVANVLVDDTNVVNDLFNGISIETILEEELNHNISWDNLDNVLNSKLEEKERKYSCFEGILNHNIFEKYVRKIVINENSLTYDIYLKNSQGKIIDISNEVYYLKYLEKFYTTDNFHSYLSHEPIDRSEKKLYLKSSCNF